MKARTEAICVLENAYVCVLGTVEWVVVGWAMLIAPEADKCGKSPLPRPPLLSLSTFLSYLFSLCLFLSPLAVPPGPETGFLCVELTL